MNGVAKRTGATQAWEEKRVKCDCSGRVVFSQGEVKYDLLNCVSLNPTVGIGERVQGAAPRVRWRMNEGNDARAAGEIWNEGNKKNK